MSLTSSSSFFGRYMRYMKFLPFFSIPFAIFFPAGLTLYWCFIASCHLAICVASRSELLKKIAGIPEFLPGTILERMVYFKKSLKFCIFYKKSCHFLKIFKIFHLWKFFKKFILFFTKKKE